MIIEKHIVRARAPQSHARLIPIALGVFMSATLVAYISGRPIPVTVDDPNYLRYARDALDILMVYVERGVLPFLSNEPLWLAWNFALGSVFDDVWVVRITVCVSLSLALISIYKISGQAFLVTLFIVLMPMVLKGYVLQLRQGFGVSVVLFSLILPVRTGVFVRLLAPFVHSSMFFVVILFELVVLFRRLPVGLSIRIIGYLFASVCFVMLMPQVIHMVGDRRAEMYGVIASSDVSGFGFLYWAVALFLLIHKSPAFYREYAISALLFYLISYFLTPVAGRILESSLPLVLLALFSLRGWRHFVFLGMFVLIVGFQIKSPVIEDAFGWMLYPMSLL